MKVGILKEIKKDEYRVSMTPAGVLSMVSAGHQVWVEHEAGMGVGFSNEHYTQAGAKIASADDIFAECDMVMHVKEPQPSEYKKIRAGQIVFTYLHLAADEPQVKGLQAAGSINIAYETVEAKDGSLPLLIPMSEVAGRLSVQEGSKYLEKHYGGRGVLLGGVPGVLPAKVLVIGGGVVGTQAAYMASGLRAEVTILDTNPTRLRYLDDVMPRNVHTCMMNEGIFHELLYQADLVIGAVLVHGAKAPKLVKKQDLRHMQKGAVMVDVSIDQGGCFETSKPTTHQDPIYEVDGILHYTVANMPGSVARTSTLALTNVTLPYALKLANLGWKKACQEDEALAKGLNIVQGDIVYQAVAEAFDMPYVPVSKYLS